LPYTHILKNIYSRTLWKPKVETSPKCAECKSSPRRSRAWIEFSLKSKRRQGYDSGTGPRFGFAPKAGEPVADKHLTQVAVLKWNSASGRFRFSHHKRAVVVNAVSALGKGVYQRSLRLRGINTLAAANESQRNHYVAGFNQSFLSLPVAGRGSIPGLEHERSVAQIETKRSGLNWIERYRKRDILSRVTAIDGEELMANLLERITINPDQCGGRPCIRGMRIRVIDVLDLFAAGLTSEQILEEMPDLETEDLRAALQCCPQAGSSSACRIRIWVVAQMSPAIATWISIK